MVTTEKILQTMNSWQSGEVIAVRRKKCSGASSHPNHHPPLHGSGAPAQSAAHRDIAAECRGSVHIELYPLNAGRSLHQLQA